MTTNFLDTAKKIPTTRMAIGQRFALSDPTIAEVELAIAALKAHKYAADTVLTCRGHAYGWISFGVEHKSKLGNGRPSGKQKSPSRLAVEAMEPGEAIQLVPDERGEMAVRVMVNQVGKKLCRVYSASVNRAAGTITVTRKA